MNDRRATPAPAAPSADDDIPGPASPPPGPSLASFAIVLAMSVAGLLVISRLPADARVATHFDVAGRADGWMPPGPACLLLPAIALAMLGLQALLPRIDPKGDNLRRSARAYRTIWLALVILLAALQAVVLVKALGAPLDVPRVVLLGTGALFVVMGNVFGKLRRNYTVGIRTPWALASERVWDRTHRFAGKCFVVTGLAMAVAGIVTLPAAWMAPFVLGAALVPAVLVFIRSWQFWREERSTA